MVQWLRFHTSNARWVDSISGGSAKFPHATLWQKKKSATTENYSECCTYINILNVVFHIMKLQKNEFQLSVK